jgi:hypothetical protein
MVSNPSAHGDKRTSRRIFRYLRPLALERRRARIFEDISFVVPPPANSSARVGSFGLRIAKPQEPLEQGGKLYLLTAAPGS